MKELQNSVLEVNEDATQCVQLHPLYKNTGMSVEDIYAELVVRQDLASIQRTNITESVDRYRMVSNPAEIFTKNSKPSRHVYLLGLPGHGKTTFCLHLLKLWCAAMTVVSSTALSVWEYGANAFHFVLYVSMRHVHRCRDSVIDMICEDVFGREVGNKHVLRHVLGSPEYRCLIMLDGLDEWLLSPEVKANLTHKGLPNTNGLSTNCTILFASRHWKVELLKPKYSANDVLVEILGLGPSGVETVIDNILTNFFKLEKDSPENKSKRSKIRKQIRCSEFESSAKVPMLVTMSAFFGVLWAKCSELNVRIVLRSVGFTTKESS